MLKGEIKPLAGQSLSGREAQIAELVAAGKRNADIAAAIGLSPNSVGVYVSRIIAKLEVRGRVGVAMWWEGRKANQEARTVGLYPSWVTATPDGASPGARLLQQTHVNGDGTTTVTYITRKDAGKLLAFLCATLDSRVGQGAQP